MLIIVYHILYITILLILLLDTFLEDFLFTHVIFMPTSVLCPALIKIYPFFEILNI